MRKGETGLKVHLKISKEYGLLVTLKKFQRKMQVGELNDVSNDTSLDTQCSCVQDPVISFQAQLPTPLKKAMNEFIETYPNWDQYRLIQAALAGFLVQNGVDSRQITRLYVGNMFSSKSLSKINYSD